MPVLSLIILFIRPAVTGTYLVDDAPYQQELVRRHIDQATGTTSATRKSRKPGKSSPAAAQAEPQRAAKPHHQPPDTPQTHLIWNAYPVECGIPGKGWPTLFQTRALISGKGIPGMAQVVEVALGQADLAAAGIYARR